MTNLSNLSDYDTDENLTPNITSQHCTLGELSSFQVSNKTFSLFHMNIRSLSFYFEELCALLATANSDFQVIGLSEIRVSSFAPIQANIELPGYNFHLTTYRSAGGRVGIYVKSNLTVSEMICLSVIWILRPFGH